MSDKAQYAALAATPARILTPDDYQRLAMRTKTGDSTELRLINAALGLAGESGEFADSIKKCQFHGHALDVAHIANELGDILWYVAQACDALDLHMSDVMQANIEKLRRRYPDGFSAERSINRER